MKLVLLVFSIFISILINTPQLAAQYGSDVYGGCEFGRSCPEPVNPPTIIEVPESPSNPQPGRVFSVNITNDQKFSGQSYQIIITPNFDVNQIARVIVFQGSELVGETTVAEGSEFVILWNLPDFGLYDLRVVVELKDGASIEQSFNVEVVSDDQTDEGPASDLDPSADISDLSPAVATSGIARTVQQARDAIVRAIESTPPAVAYSIPYLFLAFLGLLLLILLMQTKNQLKHIAIMLQLLDRDKQLADEKSNFIMLASHYIRTPLTVINGSIEVAAMNQSSDEKLAQLKTNVAGLQARFESILSEVTNNQDLANITPPDVPKTKRRLYKSPGIIIPVVLSIVVVVAINAIYLVAQKTQLYIPNISLQLILLLAVFSAFYVLWNRRSLRKVEEARLALQRDYELKLDQARNAFIQRAADELSPKVSAIEAAVDQFPVDDNTTRLQGSTAQLRSVINRFLLAAQLERGKIQKAAGQVATVAVIESVIAMFMPMIESKKLRLSRRLQTTVLWQNQALFQHVLQNLFDNAVKYTPDGSRVEVGSRQYSKNRVQVTIRNYDSRVDPEIMARLFQPFSRAEVETFNSQGLGLGLHISRLIARYLGGDITLESSEGGSTLAKVTLPIRLRDK